MSTTSPNPNNMLLLGLLAVGTLYMMQRQARAQVVSVNRGTQSANVNGAVNLVNALGRLGSLFKGSSNPTNPATTGYNPSPATAAAAAAAADADTNPDLNGSISDYASAGSDGVAYNPPNSSVWDAMSERY